MISHDDSMDTRAINDNRRDTTEGDNDSRDTTAVEEYRRIRAIQDEEYVAMLRADEAKVTTYST